MIEVLSESAPTAEVRNLDALRVRLSEILEELPSPRGVVSNLPYYITGPLLTQIAEARQHFARAVLMMQKEVGERVLAVPKTSARGSLSVYLQSQFDIRRVAVAPAGAFLPPPKVDSVVLELVPNGQFVSPAFQDFVRKGFTQPRKTLANNLLPDWNRGQTAAALDMVGLLPSARPQELSLTEWRDIYEHLAAFAKQDVEGN
jgi:16S rRNA (adenine1518-N6/adenine1519-N6)-dimethyltransferase